MSNKKSKNRKHKIWRKKLPATWSKGAHKSLKRERTDKTLLTHNN